MKEQVFINNKDLYLTWGAYLENGSVKSLRLPPNNKGYAKNDLRSQPGSRYFVDNPQPQEREVSLVMIISGKDEEACNNRMDALVEELNSGRILFRHAGLKTTYKFFTKGYQDLNYVKGLQKLSVLFVEENVKDRIKE